VLFTTLEGVILDCNDLFAGSLCNLPVHDCIGLNFSNYFVARVDYFTLASNAVQKQKVFRESKSFLNSAGDRIEALVNGRVERNAEGSVCLRWTILDVTTTASLTDELKKKNAELEKVNATMEKFLYSTSHDLRSPVTSILGLVNLMKLDNSNKESWRDYIDKIELSASKLDMIIRDLMGFTKTSYQMARSEKIEIKALLQSIISRYEKDTNFRRIHFEVAVEEGIIIFSDPERAEIIFDNLIRNAIHFCDINKSFSVVRLAARIDGDGATVQVHDNGIGISKAHQEKVFNMFYKACNLSRGAGLGLYIVKESLTQLKGSIHVESELGFGSIFTVHIPNHYIAVSS
jgi:signal transduction histidine kinase